MREILKFKYSSDIEEITVPNELGAIIGNVIKNGLKFAGVSVIAALAASICRNETNKSSKEMTEYSLQASRLVKNMSRDD